MELNYCCDFTQSELDSILYGYTKGDDHFFQYKSGKNIAFALSEMIINPLNQGEYKDMYEKFNLINNTRLPTGLAISYTLISNLFHSGIFCQTTLIPKGTKFGPLQGKIEKMNIELKPDLHNEVGFPSASFNKDNNMFQNNIINIEITQNNNANYNENICDKVNILNEGNINKFTCVEPTKIDTANKIEIYSGWEIFDGTNQACRFILAPNPRERHQDTKGDNTNSTHWMFMVNTARYPQEQNLVCYQNERSEIYYEVNKDINRGTELLIWYGDEIYDQYFGIPIGLKSIMHEHKNMIKQGSHSNTNSIMSSEWLEKSEGFQCIHCEKVFAYKYYLEKHLKYTRCVDQGDRKFPCHLCSRSFEKKDRLRIHVLHVHDKHRPHKCAFCGKSFSQSSSLNKHIRVHSGERPYKCVYCSKAFTASSILRTHMRQHSGEKPFKCKFCGKAFASHAAHDSHVRRNHNNINSNIPTKQINQEKVKKMGQDNAFKNIVLKNNNNHIDFSIKDDHRLINTDDNQDKIVNVFKSTNKSFKIPPINLSNVSKPILDDRNLRLFYNDENHLASAMKVQPYPNFDAYYTTNTNCNLKSSPFQVATMWTHNNLNHSHLHNNHQASYTKMVSLMSRTNKNICSNNFVSTKNFQ
ncbi:unnamed protein product [Gordionus sp. m RMFG-2023]|uniref:PR domain zinc finger protein 14-like n=1 Tax=Gordionus sp. m RMFG-2023 TaxID=3053472 RepID=UPI0030E2AF55